MAKKRMTTTQITDSDDFISMPSPAQALYLHLNNGADDDGFNNQVQMAMYKAHASIDDLKILLTKRFILQFESGVIVIKHWRMANSLRKDRYTPTVFQEEIKQLDIKDNGSYTWLPNGCHLVAIDKNSIDKNSIDKINDDDNKYISDEQIKIINNRCIESGIDKSIMNNAMDMFLKYQINTKDFYLKIIDVLTNDEILNKEAYISQIVRNEI